MLIIIKNMLIIIKSMLIIINNYICLFLLIHVFDGECAARALC